jgi:hypothetical protein
MNENTAGCAPGVLQAVRALTARDVAQSDRRGRIACARHFDVDRRRF